MTKEEFVTRALKDQYERKLSKRRAFLYNDADIHNINSVNRRQTIKEKGRN